MKNSNRLVGAGLIVAAICLGIIVAIAQNQEQELFEEEKAAQAKSEYEEWEIALGNEDSETDTMSDDSESTENSKNKSAYDYAARDKYLQSARAATREKMTGKSSDDLRDSNSSNTTSATSNGSHKTYAANPYKSYDEGFEAVYDDDDYDWDRYDSDDEYADGVDDAISQLEDEGYDW